MTDVDLHQRHPLAALAALALLIAVATAGCSDDDPGGADPQGADEAVDGGGEVAGRSPSPSPGCGLEPDVPLMTDEIDGDATATFTSGGVERSYRLAVPADYDPDTPVPLVLNLHGATWNALMATTYGGVARAATDRGMIVVAPDAVNTVWDLVPVGADGDFLDALLDDVASRYCVDEDRVHAIGMSLGAWRAATSACAYPGRIASLALVTIEIFPGDCEPLPVVAFHGTHDDRAPYGEGGGIDPARTALPDLPGALENMAGWATNGGCDTEAVVEPIGDDVTRHRYPGCDDGIDVELYTIIGGGHTWPSPAVDLVPDVPTTHTIDATQLALDWFEAHPRR